MRRPNAQRGFSLAELLCAALALCVLAGAAALSSRDTGERRIVLEEAEELRAWHKLSGLPLKKFFNTSSNSYKNLGLKEKLPTMSDDEQITLLATDGMLVKRPLLVTEKRVLTGFKEPEWSEALK